MAAKRYWLAACALLGGAVYLATRFAIGTGPETRTLPASSPPSLNFRPAIAAQTGDNESKQLESSPASAPADELAGSQLAPPSAPSNIATSIPISDAHRQSLEKVKALTGKDEITPQHSALANEPLDVEWSYAMEEQLRQFLIVVGAELGIDVPVVACRTTGCEIQLLTYRKPPALDRLIGQLRKQPWFKLRIANQARMPVSDAVVCWLFLKRV